MSVSSEFQKGGRTLPRLSNLAARVAVNPNSFSGVFTDREEKLTQTFPPESENDGDLNSSHHNRRDQDFITKL